MGHRGYLARAARAAIDAAGAGADRYRDYALTLHTVVADPDGIPVRPGQPPVRIIRTRRMGGVYDRVWRRFIGPSRRPHVLHMSEPQEALIYGEGGSHVLAFGTPGSGKSDGGLLWAIVQSFALAAYAGAKIGCLAPTTQRLVVIKDKLLGLPEHGIAGMLPEHWYSWSGRAGAATLPTGVQFVFRALKEQSQDTGSPLAGIDLAAAFTDEVQDALKAESETEKRGRAAPVELGFRRFCSATAKSTSRFRDWHQQRKESPDWRVLMLHGHENPFVPPEHWERLKRTLSKRDHQITVELLELASDLAVYHGWSRDRNMTQPPPLARDVTSTVLSRYRSQHFPRSAIELLVGHDPGVIHQTSVIMRCYEWRIGDRMHRCWWAMSEVVTRNRTPRQHGIALQAHLDEHYGIPHDPENIRRIYDGVPPRALIFADPHGRSQAQPDRDVYLQYQRLRLDVAPAYSGEVVAPQTRYSMINALLDPAEGAPRLCVMPGQCQFLIEGFERLERNELGKVEQRKDEHDRTHGGDALGYGLLPLERGSVKLAQEYAA